MGKIYPIFKGWHRMAINEKQKQKREWAQFHAQRMNLRFEKWQKDLDIDGRDYCESLADELVEVCEDPLRKAFIEATS